MSNWEQIIASRARHGTFVGNSKEDENAYYEFFGGSAPKADQVSGTFFTHLRRAFQLLRLEKVTFEKPALSLPLKRSCTKNIGAAYVGQNCSER